MSRKRAWDLFRRVRIFIFVFCIILSFGCFTIFSIYISKNFGQYDTAKRVFMISLVTGYAIAGTFLYLALVVKFHLWTEVARISIYILLTIVGAAFYSFVGRTYPCNLGPVVFCNDLSLSLVIGTWSLSCLLAIYACYLGIMSFIPQPLLSVETEATSGSTSPPQLSTNLVPLEPKDSGTDAKSYSEEPCPLTPLKGSKGEKHPPPSISVTPPPSYETASNSALFVQFPVPPSMQRSPQFPPGLPPASRPLPLPNPFSNRLIERSSSTSSSIPSSVTSYWGAGFQRQRSLTLSTTSYAPTLFSSTTRSDRNTGSSPGPRHPSLLTPATIPRNHFRSPPTPSVPSDFYRVGPETPRSYVSLPLPAAVPSYRDERQWANWHYPRYDAPRSASASVFSHHTTPINGNSGTLWR